VPSLTLCLLPETLAVCRLPPATPLPGWAARGGFWSLTRTPNELSIVCSQSDVPDGIQAERGWRGLQVEGPLDLSLVGVLAGLTRPLADAGVNIFAVSTYDTDYLLVKQERLEEAVRALEAAGFEIRRDSGAPESRLD
jgi:hypothetical protein